jgi:hypothetical protein
VIKDKLAHVSADTVRAMETAVREEAERRGVSVVPVHQLLLT